MMVYKGVFNKTKNWQNLSGVSEKPQGPLGPGPGPGVQGVREALWFRGSLGSGGPQALLGTPGPEGLRPQGLLRPSGDRRGDGYS